MNLRDCAYPAKLDMLQYLKPVDYDAEDKFQSLPYRLVGVVAHDLGADLHEGHYSAYVLKMVERSRALPATVAAQEAEDESAAAQLKKDGKGSQEATDQDEPKDNRIRQWYHFNSESAVAVSEEEALAQTSGAQLLFYERSYELDNYVVGAGGI
jgi:hypothetical protein